MNLRALREQTRDQHEAAEAMLPFTGPDLTRARYSELVQHFCTVVRSWESWAERHAPAPLAAMVRERRRAPLLLRDLRFFGLAPLPGSEDSRPLALEALLAGKPPDSPAYEAGFLGAMYVMEGSTLGGQYIARHAEEVLGLLPGEGDAYFRGYGEETGAMWNAFRQVLGAVPEEHTPLVIAAARATFDYVGQIMQSCPAVLQSAALPPAAVHLRSE